MAVVICSYSGESNCGPIPKDVLASKNRRGWYGVAEDRGDTRLQQAEYNLASLYRILLIIIEQVYHNLHRTVTYLRPEVVVGDVHGVEL